MAVFSWSDLSKLFGIPLGFLSKSPFKVAPYSFLTARELVSKSRDGASFKKSTRKSRVTSTTASNLHRSSLSNHRCSFPMC